MPFERQPRRLVPRGMKVEGAIDHRVRDGESWKSLAVQYHVSADTIIYANFQTLVPEEVNWYLRHYIGCKRATHDGDNWMFSSDARPGIIQIPPTRITFGTPLVIVAKPPPRFYTVTVEPSKWSPPEGVVNRDAKTVVNLKPWQHASFSIGGVTIQGRKQWKASMPIWKNEIIYYNTKAYPLAKTYKKVIVHHTDNNDPINDVEAKQKRKGYSALGYHFFIDRAGAVFEGRPLQVMGSNAGVGAKPGPMNDPDWEAIGITLQGDYHHSDDFFWSTDAPKKQLQTLEDLVVALKGVYPIARLLMHREVPRSGKPTVCPGDHMVPHVKALRTKLKIAGP